MKTNKRSIEAIYPLSALQQGMLFHSLADPGAGMYMEQHVQEFTGNVDSNALQTAWTSLIQRHAVLRTLFIDLDTDTPLQVVRKQVALPWQEHDWREFSAEEQTQQLADWLKADRQQGFNVEQAPLMRLTLIRLSEDRYDFICCYHHALLDGWSNQILFKDLLTYHEAALQGHSPTLPRATPYQQYILWLAQRDNASAETHWRQYLHGFSAPTPLMTDRHTAKETSDSITQQKYQGTLSEKATKTLQALVRSEQLTLNVVAQCAWALLLSRYSGEQDIVFGKVVSGRSADIPGIETIVGPLINTLPSRIKINPESDILSWLQQQQRSQTECIQYEHTPLIDIQRWSDVAAGTGLFESLYVFENYPVDANADKRSIDIGFNVTGGSLHEQNNYPLSIMLGLSETLAFQIDYDPALFDQSTIERLTQHYRMLLEGIAENSQQKLSELSLLSKAERQKILYEWNETQTNYPQDKCIHQLFEEQAEKTPNATAVVYEDQQLTYRELNQQSNQLAHYLIEQGVGPESRVALCLERSFEMMIGILGILKTGAAYVPLDPSYPLERIQYILKDAEITKLVTQATVLEGLSFDQLIQKTLTSLCMDTEATILHTYPVTNPTCKELGVTPNHLAYVIYTSGSTGQPKGCLVTHSNVARLFQTTNTFFGFNKQDVWTLFHSYAFDFSVWEMWGALLYGGRVVVVPYWVCRSPEDFYALLQREQVTVLNQTPAFFSQVIAIDQQRDDKTSLTLRYVIFGGDALDFPSLRDWVTRYGYEQPQLINMYGITETTVHVTLHRITADDITDSNPISLIGRPLDDLHVYLLDAYQQLVPIGVPGELYVSGRGVVQGYLNRPELTTDKFVENPYIMELPAGQAKDHSRLYRSGDKARYRQDGVLEYLGRLDDQVKIRGFRIELGEIENALTEQADISSAITIALSSNQTAQSNYLVAYVVPKQGVQLDQGQLRTALQKVLPNYMVPAFFISLDRFPLTPNGKIDKKSLPQPDAAALQSKQYIPPNTETEQALIKIWVDVLKVKADDIGLYSNFFELGGHSLLATQVVSWIRKHLDVEIKIRDLFTSPTLHALAIQVDKVVRQPNLTDNHMIPLKPVSRNQNLPLSYAQQRLWFLNQYEDEKDISYNIPWALRLTGILNIAALKNTFNTIIQRHESLRTTFRMVDGEAVQIISDELLLDIPTNEITETEITDYVRSNTSHLFNLEQGPLLKISLLRMSEQEHILLLNLHHIISDGWSIGIFNQEFSALHKAYSEGKPSPLAPLPIQYPDFSCWQRQWLQGDVLKQEIGYWREKLEGSPKLIHLPTDRPRPSVQSSRGDIESFAIPLVISKHLINLAQKENGTLFMVLMAAFKVLLYRYSGETDIVVGTGIANRQLKEVEGLIGFFVNTLVFRDHIVDELPFTKFLQQVIATAIEAYEHQDIPFEHIVDKLKPERNLSSTPFFNVSLIVQNMPTDSFELPGLKISPVKYEACTAKFDLSLFFFESPEELNGMVEYSTDLFDKSTILRLIDHFKILLKSIVSNPYQRLDELSLLDESDKKRILYDWNSTEYAYPKEQCIHHLFEDQVTKTPKSIAVIYETKQLTYAELNKKGNQLAHYLIEQGVKPEVKVGVCIERSLEMVIAILGILKAGGVYVPIDPDYPEQRIRHMLSDSSIVLLLTKSTVLDTFQKTIDVPCLTTEKLHSVIVQYRSENPKINLAATNLAYVVYTSGSTGKPKGVMVSHHAFVNHMLWLKRRFDINPNDKILQKTPLSFDAAGWEWSLPLLTGAQLILAKPGGHREPEYLIELIIKYAVTVLQTVPSLLNLLLSEDNIDEIHSLRFLFCGGEPLPADLCKKWNECNESALLCNLYGPTEATIDSTFYPVNTVPYSNTIPIGQPIDNAQIYLLDNNLHPVPAGIIGELYIGGAGLARGYLNKQALTAEKFIPNSFAKYPGERLYRSGDLARYLSDGNIEFSGRVDDQVKIRGFRIELGEIETRLTENPAIQESVVMAREDKPGEQQLVAYLVVDKHYQLPDTDVDELNTQAVAQWQDVFDTTHETIVIDDPFHDFTGWNSSYTSDPIPEVEMREWQDNTVDRLLELKPQNVLEVGCGTGLLMGQIISYCERYVGIDLSLQVINQLKSKLPALNKNAEKVTLLASPADNLSILEEQKFDTIIINSVVQYFPGIDYLVNVLTESLKRLVPGGKIFIGDIRHFGLLDIFHTSVQLYKSNELQPISQFTKLIQSHVNNDKELVISPDFFQAFKIQLPQITHVQIVPKLGNYRNELSKYRYDVVLHTSKALSLLDDIDWTPWIPSEFNVKKIQEHLTSEQPDYLALTHVTNAHLFRDIQAEKYYREDEEKVNTVSDLKARLTTEAKGVTPYELIRLAEGSGYTAEISWANSNVDGSFDVVFHKKSNYQGSLPLSPFPCKTSTADLHSLANNPQLQHLKQILQPSLQDYLLEALPDYMVPAFYVFLDSLPLTSSGKIDQKALPSPDVTLQTQEYVAPNTETEQQLVKIWSDVLNIPEDKIGIHYNFFELGGNSISVIRVIGQCRKYDLNLTPKAVFEEPTIQALAIHCKGTSSNRKTVITLKSEIQLDDQITSNNLPLAQTDIPKAILLTGATGFIGAYLLKELIKQPEVREVYCLVRPDSSLTINQKLKQKLIEYKLYDENEYKKVIPIEGDLSLPLLGITSDRFDELSETIDVIFHNGAWVNHVYPYDLLRKANVSGTHEILKLATHKKLKTVHHISILTNELLNEKSFDEFVSTQNYGYILTKYAAEKMIAVASKRGVPVCVHRLGMISGDSKTGVSNTSDRICLLIKGCVKLKYIPDTTGLSNICSPTLTPVNIAADTIIRISKKQDSVSKTYNINNSVIIQWSELLKAFDKIGYDMKTLPLEQWKEKLLMANKSYPNDIYETLIGLYINITSPDRKPDLSLTNDNICNSDETLPLSNIIEREINGKNIDSKIFYKYLKYFIASNFIQK